MSKELINLEEWREYSILDVFEVTNGLSKNRKEFGFGYPFLTFKEVFNNYFLPENLLNLANSSDKEREKCSIKRGDVFITRTSEKFEELGITSVALKDYENATFNGFTKRLRPNNSVPIIPEFSAFYFKSPQFRTQILSFTTMTTRASLNNTMLNNLKVKIPPIEVQQKISKILKAIHDKIELNNQMNQNLEEMAQALFKQWFVDFEFPNEDGEPYKSSGGEMVESELGLIPKGWEVKRIEETVKIIRGASPRPIKDFIKKTGIPWVKISDATSSNSKFLLSTKEFIKKEGKNKSRYIEKETLILSNSATPGIPKIMKINACVHDGWLIFNEYKNISKEFLYYSLLYEKEKILQLSNGSVFRNLKTDILKKYKIVLPNNKLLEKITNYFIETNTLIYKNEEETENLTQIRNTLLPKLMNGEIDVNEVEI